MVSPLVIGIALISMGGFADGSYGLMLKYTRLWQWEHTWLVFNFVAFTVFPWVWGASTVRDLAAVLTATARHGLTPVLLFGLGWGCGAVLYGLALSMAGLALSYAIVMGLTASVGSLAPLVLLHREEVFTFKGLVILGGLLFVVIGVTLCAWAATLKDQALTEMSETHPQVLKPQRIMLGVGAAILSGIFSPMLNLSFAYGSPLTDFAVSHGTSPLMAPNVISAVALSGGSLINIIYCSYLISTRRTWTLFLARSRDSLLGLVMGLLGPLGTILYGMGSSQLGKLGVVVGWPIMSSMGILSANFWGALSGEWSGAGRKPAMVMSAAVTLLLVAMFILGWANSLS
jgi:L-rhamnose-H+ transport protein